MDKELWDAYDQNCNKINNIILKRGEADSIPDGMFHIVCDVVLKHKDGTFLLMQRDPNKHFPLKWELTAGGSILLGETPLEGAKRELKEETGIEGQNFERLGMLINPNHHTIYLMYIAFTDCDKDSVKLQKGETVAYKWVGNFELNNPERLDLAVDRSLRALKQTEYYAH